MPMRFPYLKAARLKLQERQKACLKSSYEAAGTHTLFFLDFIKKDPVIQTISAELSIIAVEKFSDGDALIDNRQRRLRLPETQIDCAAFWMRCLEVLLERDLNFPNFPMIFGSGSNRIQDMYNDFFEQVLNPLCAYIDERIDEGDLLLYSLSRYQRECSWFESDKLAMLAAEAESGKLEAVMDEHLRSWLFREGIDYPYSTPSSPSGRADVIVWHGEKPLPIEVKVFDGENRDTAHVRQGLWQAHRYAVDYTVPFGYLVVFNTSQHLLSFEDNVHKEGPPCVVVSGMNVFAIVVNVGPRRPTASKEKPLETKVVKTPGGPTEA
jgi:hypothetical protein